MWLLRDQYKQGAGRHLHDPGDPVLLFTECGDPGREVRPLVIFPFCTLHQSLAERLPHVAGQEQTLACILMSFSRQTLVSRH